mmetsp:Transcript_104924/g.146292  ORF Transcript_104924/g.146292 Transcript_104924/m.146292 type:complete len:211 (-) Transcript_104924:57-689(-)
MICRRLKYENTFLVVKDEMNIRRARSHSPKMTTEDLDTTPVRSRESAKYYVSLLEAFISDPGSKLPETVDSPPKRGEKMKGGPSQRAAGRSSANRDPADHSKLDRTQRQLLCSLAQADLLSYLIQHLRARATLTKLPPTATEVVRLLEGRLASLPVLPKTAGAQPNVELLRQSFEQMTFMRLLDFVPAQCKDAEVEAAVTVLRRSNAVLG